MGCARKVEHMAGHREVRQEITPHALKFEGSCLDRAPVLLSTDADVKELGDITSDRMWQRSR